MTNTALSDDEALELVYVPNAFCLHIGMPCSAGRGKFLEQSAAGHAVGRRVHYGAGVGPERAPPSGCSKYRNRARNREITCRLAMANQDHGNTPNVILFHFLTLSAAVSEVPKQQSTLGSQGTAATPSNLFPLLLPRKAYLHGCACVCMLVCLSLLDAPAIYICRNRAHSLTTIGRCKRSLLFFLFIT